MTQRATDRLAIDGGAPVRTEPLHPDKGMAYINAEEREAVLQVLESRSLFRYYGPDLQNAVRSLELGFAEKMGVPYAVAVSSGTAALRTALAAIGVSEGDEVIIPAVTFIATVGAAVAQRAVPVFAEVDASLTLDPEDFEAKISPRTRAVIPVHLGNVPCRMDEIMAVARRHGIAVIEDVAQAAGASYKGRRLGSIGDLGAFSLQLEKNITSGEGGIVTTNSYELFDRVTRFQDQGGQFRIQSGEVRETTEGEAFVGENLRMAELAGAVAGVQLRRLDGLLDAMRANKRRVKHLLSDLPGLEFRDIPDPEGDGGSGITFFIDTEERAKRVVQALRAEGIPAGQVYGGLPVYANPQILHKRTAWTGCPWHCAAHPTTVEYYMGLCPRSEDLLTRSISIGIGPRYTEQDCQDIVLAVRKVAEHAL
jgi:8-amino-3,8-dideoxy-alpha-D-manno-octulosonate transaminase